MNEYKTKLEEELKTLVEELKSVGRINPSNSADWEPTPVKDWDADKADENEVADTIEEYEDNTAILKPLEIRFNEIKSALERIEKGTFGVCATCGAQIEKGRLDANPAANTCMKCMNL
jgi:RNA polymerase-binding transcription factor DksA